MERLRKPCQGVFNIIRFNWHYYVLSVLSVTGLCVVSWFTMVPYSGIAEALSIVISFSILISLLVSTYIYDYSALYRLTWLNQFEIGKNKMLVNIHAGFDETSILLKQKYISASNEDKLQVFDFYDPAKHTEVSIQRARKAYPGYHGTVAIETTHIPLPDECVDVVFNILAAHEIREEEERVTFFKEQHRILRPAGKIIVTEHLRDVANFMAYNIGFFHFHSKATWSRTFQSAGFRTETVIKITPFITTFILVKHGTPS